MLITERGQAAIADMSLDEVEIITRLPRSSLYAAIKSLGLDTIKTRGSIAFPVGWTAAELCSIQ